MNGEGDGGAAEQPPAPAWPRQQVYFITVEWEDEPHSPESPEQLAQMLRQAIVHRHDHGPGMQPSRFVVRVKAGDGAAEVRGTVAHHHHHSHGAPADG